MTKKLRKSLLFGLMALFTCLILFMSLSIRAVGASVVMGNAINYGDYISGSTWTTHYYHVNNKIAYCVEPKEPSVPSGDYFNIQTANSHQLNLLVRVLAYGYGGPYDITASMWPGASDDQRYLYTHIAASYAYQSGYTLEITGLTEEQLESTGIGNFLRACATAEMHYGEVNIVIPDGSYQDLSFLAYFQQTEPTPDQPDQPGVQPEVTVNINILKKDANGTYISSYYSLENAEYGLYDSTNTLIESHLTDGNGSIVFDHTFDTEGEYYIKEINPSKGYYIDSTNYRFNVTRSGDELVLSGSSGVTVNNNVLSLESNEKPYMANLSLYKTDSESGNKIMLSGAVFRIKDLTTGQYLQVNGSSDLSTDERGEIKIPFDIRYGSYQIEEIKAPYGYSKAPSVTVTVDGTKGYGTNASGNIQCDVNIQEQPIYGSISIYKKGEMLTGFSNGVFEYSERMLKGVTYELYADENIYTYDNNLSLGQRNMIYAKDQLVETIVTTDAVAVVNHLPMGKYYLIEKSAPEGYEINEERINITVSGESNETLNPVINELNLRKKAAVHIYKKDNYDIAVVGAEYGLYAGEDIYDVDGNLLVAKDELICNFVTDDTGSIDFGDNLPLFKFYIKEIQATYGYLRDVNLYDIDALDSALNNNTIEYEVIDSMAKGVITLKKDVNDLVLSSDGEIINEQMSLEGAKWQLIAGDDIYTPQSVSDRVVYVKGDVIAESTTDENGTIVWDDLYPGKYILKEISVPYGVVLYDSEIETELIYIDDMTNIISQRINVTDEVNVGKISLIKTGEGLTDYKDGQFIYEEVGLKSSTWELSADEDVVSNITGNVIYAYGEVIDTKDTDEDGIVVFDNLPVGKYLLKEIKAPYGCVISDEIIHVSIDADNTKQEVVSSVSAYNERQHLSINMNKISNWHAPLKDCEFELINNEDIYSYDGELLVESGTVVAKAVSDEEGKVDFNIDLPNCIYTLRESKAADGFYNYDFEEVIDFKYYEEKSDVPELTYGKTLVNDYIYGTQGRIYLVLGSYASKKMYKMDDIGIGGCSYVMERAYDCAVETLERFVADSVSIYVSDCSAQANEEDESAFSLFEWIYDFVANLFLSMAGI